MHIGNEAPGLIERRLEDFHDTDFRGLAAPQILGDLLRRVLEEAFGTFVSKRPGSEPIGQDDNLTRSRPMTDVNSDPQEPPTGALGEEGLGNTYVDPTIPNGAYTPDNGIEPMMDWQLAGADDFGNTLWTLEAEQDPGMSTTRTRQRHNTPIVESNEYDTLLNVDAFIRSVDFSGQDFEQFTSMLEQLAETASYPDSAYQSAGSGTHTPDDKRKDKGKSIEKRIGGAFA